MCGAFFKSFVKRTALFSAKNLVILDFNNKILYNPQRFFRPHSSVGQSSRLIIDWSQVQVLLGAPLSLYYIILFPSKTQTTDKKSTARHPPNYRSVQLVARNCKCSKGLNNVPCLVRSCIKYRIANHALRWNHSCIKMRATI